MTTKPRKKRASSCVDAFGLAAQRRKHNEIQVRHTVR